jgi:hypothetical protein
MEIEAAEALRTACGLLSVAWWTSMTVRVGPKFFGSDPRDYLTKSEYEDSNEIPPYEVDVPPWLDQAASMILEPRNGDLRDALDGYFFALSLRPEFPSHACISLAACIEAVGERIRRRAKLSTKGAMANFREGLNGVLYRDEARKVQRVYSKRSSTAHDGRVHGTQRAFGLRAVPGLLASTDTENFDQMLFAMEKAARRLLIAELGGPKTWEPLTADDMPRGLVMMAVAYG